MNSVNEMNFHNELEKLKVEKASIERKRRTLQVNLIKYVKYRHNITSGELSERLHITKQMMSLLEQGKRNITEEMFERLNEMTNE